MRVIRHSVFWTLTFPSPNRYLASNMLKDKSFHLQNLLAKSKPHKNIIETTAQGFAAKIISQIDNKPTNQLPSIKTVGKSYNLKEFQPLKRFIQKQEHQNRDMLKKINKTQMTKSQQIQNSQTFMKYLDHALQKKYCHQIISVVESYCSKKQQIIGFNHNISQKTYSIKTQNQINELKNKFISEITDLMMSRITIIEDNRQNCKLFVNSLIQCLHHSDFSYICNQRFDREIFQLDFEEVNKQNNQLFKKINWSEFMNEEFNTVEVETPVNTETEKQNQKHRKALQRALKLSDDVKQSKLQVKKSFLTQQNHQNVSYKIDKLAGDKTVFKKINSESVLNPSKIKQNLKYAYVYQLPFNVSIEETDQFVSYLQTSKGIKIQQYTLTPYKNVLQNNPVDIIYRISEQINSGITGDSLQKSYLQVSISEFNNKSKDSNNKRRHRLQNSQFKDVPLDNEPISLHKSVTDNLLLKIKKQNYSKFNKSSMIIKFSSIQDKQKILTKDSRLYGLNYKNLKNIKFQQGYSKTTITLKGITEGCTTKQLQKQVNRLLNPMKLSINIEQELVMIKNYALIQFDYMTEAIKAIQLLNNMLFQNKTLKAHLVYGPCTLFKSEYKNEFEDSFVDLKKKIELSSHFYALRYEQEDKITH